MTNTASSGSEPVPNRRSVTVAGTYNELTGEFAVRPMFVGGHEPTCLEGREAVIRGRERDAVSAELNGDVPVPTQAKMLQIVADAGEMGKRICLVPLEKTCADGAPWDGTLLFATNFSYSGRVERVDFILDGALLYSTTIAHTFPSVTLLWRPGETPPRGRQVVAWNGEHKEVDKLFYYLAFEHSGGVRVPLTLITEDTQTEVDFSALPAGVGRLVVTSSDGYNTVEAFTDRFYVIRRECQAVIYEPTTGSSVPSSGVVLRGIGYYDDGTTVETDALEWSSDRDGPLGRGAHVVPSIELATGRHQIELTAGLPGCEGRTSITFEVLRGNG